MFGDPMTPYSHIAVVDDCQSKRDSFIKKLQSLPKRMPDDSGQNGNVLQVFGPRHLAAALDKIHLDGINVTNMSAKDSAVPLAENAILSSQALYPKFGIRDVLAYAITTAGKKIVYIGNCGRFKPYKLIPIALNAQTLICEVPTRISDREAGKLSGALSPAQAGNIAQRAGVKTLVLTHLPGTDTQTQVMGNCLSSGFRGNIIVPNPNTRYSL
ncbi:MAG: hypothetical protein WAZ14_02730 [Patescibacteria group bacterium]